MNDTAPIVTASQLFRIAENASNGDSLGLVGAMDADVTGSLQTWSIVSGNGDGVFEIDAATGELRILSNANLDRDFAPFGEVVEGMEVVDSLYAGYGEEAPRGRGPAQGRALFEGNDYLKKAFPHLDYIKRAVLVE